MRCHEGTISLYPVAAVNLDDPSVQKVTFDDVFYRLRYLLHLSETA
jgi:hypothetical protein